MDTYDGPEFSNPEVEAAYWDAVDAERDAKNDPLHIQEARRRTLLRWLPTEGI